MLLGEDFAEEKHILSVFSVSYLVTKCPTLDYLSQMQHHFGSLVMCHINNYRACILLHILLHMFWQILQDF